MTSIAAEFTIDEMAQPLPGEISASLLHDQIVTLLKRRAELAQKLQQAERRTERDKRQLLLSLLEINDAFDRIFRGVDLTILDETSRYLIGDFKATSILLENTLTQEEVVPMEELEGATFDPHTQEVIEVETQVNGTDGLVLEVRERGYYWREKLLRRAKVVVSKKM